MSRISLQFHGTCREVLDFVNECARDFGVHVVYMWRSPAFRVELVRTEEEARALSEAIGCPTYVRLLIRQPVLGVTSEGDFSSKNPTAMLIDIGDQTEHEMKESFIGAKTDDATAMKLWRRIATEWRKRTLSGATAVNPRTGARGVIKTHRFTRAASDLDRAGVRMWALGGKSFYELSRERS